MATQPKAPQEATADQQSKIEQDKQQVTPPLDQQL